jgi:hypothetical protein
MAPQRIRGRAMHQHKSIGEQDAQEQRSERLNERISPLPPHLPEITNIKGLDWQW